MIDPLTSARQLEARIATFSAQAADLACKADDLQAAVRRHIRDLEDAARDQPRAAVA